jgi:trans-2,3-dihydro-3-hydroxyanthranilate isomerase
LTGLDIWAECAGLNVDNRQMALPLHTLDVFTDRRFSGNPLAVVSDADALSADQMKAIARELNLSETVFVLKPQNPAHSARMRIFTPQREVPFAGHPTIGTAILLAQARTPLVNGASDVIIVMEQEIGTVRVGVRLRAGHAPFAEFDAPKMPEKSGTPATRDRLADALGLLPREIGFENHTALCLTAGNSFAFVPVSTLEAISKARVSAAHWAATFPDDGVYLYTRECVHNDADFHARMFAPQFGIAEDPATDRRRFAWRVSCTASTGCRMVPIGGSSNRATRWDDRAPSSLPWWSPEAASKRSVSAVVRCASSRAR